MITNVGMIILLEHDLDAAVDFYKKLDLKLIFHIKESWAEFAIGSIKLGLCPTSQLPHDRLTGVVLEVDNIKKMYADLKDVITFKGEPLEKVHGIMVGIQDPGGNIIDLYQPTPDKVQKLVQDVVRQDQQQKQGCCASGKCQCKQQKGHA